MLLLLINKTYFIVQIFIILYYKWYGMEEVIDSTEEKIQQSGGSVSVYIPARWKKEYDLSQGDTVNVSLVNNDGRIEIRVDELGGFSIEEFQEMAEEEGWKCTDSFEMDGEWSYTYMNNEVTIEIDSTMSVNDTVVNNVFVRGAQIPFDGHSPDEYIEFCDKLNAFKPEVRDSLVIDFNDSKGLYQRLVASDDSTVEPDCLPSAETMGALIENTEYVTAQFKWSGSSLVNSLDEIKTHAEHVRQICREMNNQ